MRPGIDRPACAAIAVAAALLAGGDAAAQATEPSSPAGLYGSLSGLYVWAPESSWAARYESGIANRGDYGWESGPGAVAALGYDTVFAWQAMAGVRHALSDRAELHVGYRFFSTADWQLGGRDADGDAWRSEVDYRTHNLEGGVTFRF